MLTRSAVLLHRGCGWIDNDRTTHQLCARSHPNDAKSRPTHCCERSLFSMKPHPKRHYAFHPDSKGDMTRGTVPSSECSGRSHMNLFGCPDPRKSCGLALLRCSHLKIRLGENLSVCVHQSRDLAFVFHQHVLQIFIV